MSSTIKKTRTKIETTILLRSFVEWKNNINCWNDLNYVICFLMYNKLNRYDEWYFWILFDFVRVFDALSMGFYQGEKYLKSTIFIQWKKLWWQHLLQYFKYEKFMRLFGEMSLWNVLIKLGS